MAHENTHALPNEENQGTDQFPVRGTDRNLVGRGLRKLPGSPSLCNSRQRKGKACLLPNARRCLGHVLQRGTDREAVVGGFINLEAVAETIPSANGTFYRADTSSSDGRSNDGISVTFPE